MSKLSAKVFFKVNYSFKVDEKKLARNLQCSSQPK